jgi:RNA polymerase sigma-70 factor (ECF subfamily)
MLGSAFEADDAAQETIVRAWKNADSFEGRSAVRSWLYRIATNVCLDMLRGRRRRARPMDMGPSQPADGDLGPQLPENLWVTPIPDDRVLPPDGNPEELALARESIRLAFVTALQHLPARQRAVLILREVLRWQASEVAELLETSVPSVNSALQRARATLESLDLDEAGAATVDGDQEELLRSYVDAFEAYDIKRLVTLLQDDAKFSMPPWPLWLEGPAEIHDFMLGTGAKCENSKVIVTSANGGPAFAIYNHNDGAWTPWAIVVMETSDGRVSGLHHFIYPELFAEFGLPARLEG